MMAANGMSLKKKVSQLMMTPYLSLLSSAKYLRSFIPGNRGKTREEWMRPPEVEISKQ